ncbi:hypothetical protein AJ85_00845 [Alkalihalobacillus alcalophilus ATCC 27647 = CGMCC 1.3604]|uniref:Uncharacterized protein n=1 Tax=Alkalihalobacillus alcalophilus ATCC 27647 = CGMCC 1.3604 TaxID=1218173 RepID=A0A094WHG5_ALKAL|nr:hypothetical protein [Alkalihalobacillus alcalophilus]KGA97219.1 hypothetical protein BALCAV_0211465 [Alkalihalobacillus alcalophilus ATCC 27647 = CGMCC 1.3604]MED1561538.1 hypothetical protein [Alkalihalobacillus alcalophilus]THG88687.1 hypothetical protein AJ85_00845 [Alkalihalobacillus alcalophilus ATCC 27647 = CGMCC 1.3604]
MNKETQEHKRYLENQLQQAKQQDQILAQIEEKLYKMKEIAEFARDFQLSMSERNKLNTRINDLKVEVSLLEKKLQPTVH